MCLACEEDAAFFVAYFGDTGGNPWRPSHQFGIVRDGQTPAATPEQQGPSPFICDEPAAE